MTGRQHIAMFKPLVVVLGPTAIGKSRIAIQVAKTMETEILTADSRQVYRGMDIGTDKPTMVEREGVPHRLIDLVDPDQPFNVGDYRRRAVVEIDRLHRAGRIPLVVGGTGLYVRALVRGLWPGPPANWELRRRLEGEAAVKGLDYLHQELARVDPELAHQLHPHDRVKVLRGLEVYQLAGLPLSEAHRRHRFQEAPFLPLMIGLTMDRDALARRIEARVQVELAKGLVHETQRLMEQGYGQDLGSMKSLGYRQIARFLVGELSYEEAVRQLNRDTRHFAKRQMTWFRKEPNINWLCLEEEEATEPVATRILDCVEQFVEGLKKSTSLSAHATTI